MRRLLAAVLLLAATLSADAAKRRAVSPGGSCPAGGTLVVDAAAFAFEMDAANIYFHDDLSNFIYRQSKSGGTRQPVIDLQLDLFAAMTSDADNVYVAAFAFLDEEFPSTAPPTNLYAAPKAGGEQVLLEDNVILPYQLVTDETHIYWSSAGTINFDTGLISSDGKIERIRKDGTGRETLVDDLSVPLGIALDGNDVLFAESGLAFDDFSAGIRRVAKTGGPVTSILEGPSVLSLTVTGEQLVFVVINPTTEESVGLFRLNKTGGDLTTLSLDRTIIGIPQVLGGKVYYATTSRGGDTISSIPLAGGVPAVVVGTLLGTDDFELDGCLLYYGTIDDEIIAVRRQ